MLHNNWILLLLGLYPQFGLQNSHSYEDHFTICAGSSVALLMADSQVGTYAVQELWESFFPEKNTYFRSLKQA
jgi:hypothetical protein